MTKLEYTQGGSDVATIADVVRETCGAMAADGTVEGAEDTIAKAVENSRNADCQGTTIEVRRAKLDNRVYLHATIELSFDPRPEDLAKLAKLLSAE